MKEHGLLKTDHNSSNVLKAVFHKFYLVHSWILCLNSCAIYQIFTDKYHTWNPKFYLSLSSSYNFTPINKCRSRKSIQPIKNCQYEITYSDIVLRLFKCTNKDKTWFKQLWRNQKNISWHMEKYKAKGHLK